MLCFAASLVPYFIFEVVRVISKKSRDPTTRWRIVPVIHCNICFSVSSHRRLSFLSIAKNVSSPPIQRRKDDFFVDLFNVRECSVFLGFGRGRFCERIRARNAAAELRMQKLRHSWPLYQTLPQSTYFVWFFRRIRKSLGMKFYASFLAAIEFHDAIFRTESQRWRFRL